MLLPHDIDVLVVESQATMRAQLRNMLTSIGIDAPQFAVSATMAMRRLRAVAGVDDVSIHDMRRAVSNWMKDQGIGREVRDLALNHLDPSVDGRHYSGSARMELQVRAAMQAWAEHIERVLSGGPELASELPAFA